MAMAEITVVDNEITIVPFGSELITESIVQAAADAAAQIVADIIRVDDDQNIFMGDEAGETNGGVQSFGGGYRALRLNQDGEFVAIGVGASQNRTTGARGVVIGVQADGAHDEGGDGTITIGHNGATLNEGDQNTGVGDGVFPLLTTGDRNIGIGPGAGGSLDTGSDTIGIGPNAGQSGDGGLNKTIAIGPDVQCNREAEARIGHSTLDKLWAGPIPLVRIRNIGELDNASLYFGNAGNDTDNVGGNTGAGARCMTGSSTGALNSGYGLCVMENRTNNTGNNSFFGAYAARHLGQGGQAIDNVGLGGYTFGEATQGIGGSAIGFRAFGKTLNTAGNTGVGDSIGWLFQGTNAFFAGYTAAEYTTAGLSPIAIGIGASKKRADGDYTVFVGPEAGSFYTATVDGATGAGAVSGGDRVIGIGRRSMALTTGDDHVGVGDQTGLSLTGGSGSSFFGSGSGNDALQKVDAVNSLALGIGSYTTKDHQAVIGGTNITETLLRGKIIINAASTSTTGRVDVANAKITANVASPADGNLVLTDTTSMAAGVGGSLVFRGAFTGTTVTEAAAIQALKSNGTAGQFGFDMAFYTRVNGGINSEKMRVTTGGLVGIGTAAPSGRLHVAWTADAELVTLDRTASSAADGAWPSLKMKATRTGTMGDGMGVSMQFAIQDAAAVEQTMGFIQCVRRASNDEGEILVRPRNAAGPGFAQGLAVRGDQVSLKRQTAPVAGGDATAAFTLTSNLVGIYAGSGAPTIAAAKGSLYMRTDGTGTNDRIYVNTNGSTTWTAMVTVA